MTIQAQRERRNALVKEAKHLHAEHSVFTPELSAQYNSLMDQIGHIEDGMAREQKILDLDADKKFDAILKDVGGSEVDAPSASIGNRFMRNGYEGFSAEDYKKVRNTLSVGGAGSEGGFTVQTEVVTQVLNALLQFGGMRSVAEIIQTAQGNPMSFPTSNGTAELGEIIAENASATSLDPSFGTLPLSVYKFSSKIIAVPFELLQDSAVDIEKFINDRIVTRLGRIQNSVFTTGTGTLQPTGIVTAANTGVTAAVGGTATVKYADLIDLQHSVDPIYRSNAKYMMHDQTVRAIRKITDTNGRPLYIDNFDQGITGGTGGSLAGAQVVTNQQMPIMAANAKSILFGDFSYYKIRDVMAMNLFRFTDSVYASKGQVGFLAWMRSGGNFIDVGGAVKAFANSAT